MIKLSQLIPEMIPDGSNAQAMTDFLVAIKQCVDELARKAKSIQEATRYSIPVANDLEEKEDVDYVAGATIRRYTKIDGTIRYNAET